MLVNRNEQTVICNAADVTSAAQSTSARIWNYEGCLLMVKITETTPPAQTVPSSGITPADDVITKANHGFLTGTKVRAATAGLLPTGLLLSTDYFVIALNANQFKLASSLSNALAAVPVPLDLTTAGTGNQTITPQPLGGSIILQGSLNNVDFADIKNSQESFAAAGNLRWNLDRLYDEYIRAKITVTSGVARFDFEFRGKV